MKEKERLSRSRGTREKENKMWRREKTRGTGKGVTKEKGERSVLKISEY